MKISFTPFHCFETHVPEQTARAEHVHDIHEFVICINGNGTQYTGGMGIHQRRGDVFCFPSGMPHYCSGKSNAPAGLYVIMVPDSMFTPDAYGDHENYLVLQKIIALARQGRNPLPLREETAHRVLSLAREMKRESHGKKPGYQAAIRLLFQNIFLHIMRDPVSCVEISPRIRKTYSYYDERMAHVLRFIDGHFMETITVGRILKIAGMSRSHFHAVFRALAGCTLIAYVTRVRIRAAQRLLCESDTPIIQIAMDCGFPTLSRFYAAFKSITGKTPRRVRAEFMPKF